MAQPLPSAEPMPFAVFVDTSLETHLAVLVSPDDTVLELKRKVVMEHASGFPEIGAITILAIKVKRRAALYRLSESMKVRDAFVGIKGSRFLYVDAAQSVDVKTLAAKSSVGVLGAKVEKLGKSYMLQTEPGAGDASQSIPNTRHCSANDIQLLDDDSANNDQNLELVSPSVYKEFSPGSPSPAHNLEEKIPRSEFHATESDKPIAVESNRLKDVTISENDLTDPSSGQEIREGSSIVEHGLANADIQSKSDMMIDLGENGTRGKPCENLPFDAKEECTEVPLTSSTQHTKRMIDFAGNEKKRKGSKKLKGKKSTEDCLKTQLEVAGIESNKYDHDLENVSRKESPIDAQNNTEGSLDDLADQFEKTKGTTDCNVKNRDKKQIGKDSAEDGVEMGTELTGLESNELKPLSEKILELVPHHVDVQNKMARTVDKLFDQPRDSNEITAHVESKNLETLVTDKKRHKKSKGKKSVEDGAQIQPQAVGSKANELEPNREKIPGKASQCLLPEHPIEPNVDELADNSLKFKEKNVCSSPKKTMQRKRKKRHHQVDYESLAEADEHPHKSEEQIIGEKSKSENMEVSGQEFNSTLVDEVPNEKITPKDVESGVPSKKKVKKPRHKQSLDSDKEQTLTSMMENATYVQIPTIDGHPRESPAPIDDHSVQTSEVVLDIGESAHKVTNKSSIKAELVGSSNANKSHLNESSTDFIVGSSLDSSNKNVVPDSCNLPLKGDDKKAAKDHDQCLAVDEAGEILADMRNKVPPVAKSKSKRQKKLKETIKPKHDASNNESNCFLEGHQSFRYAGDNAIDLQPSREESLNFVSRDPIDANSGKPRNGRKKKSHSSNKEPPKALAPEYSEVLRSGTPNSAKQVTEDHSDENVLSLKVTGEDIQKEPEENIDDSERNPKILEIIDGKASRHRRKKGKNDPPNQRSLDIGTVHSSEHQVTQELQKRLDQGIAYKNAVDCEKMCHKSAEGFESSEKKHRRNKKKTEKVKPSDPIFRQSEVTDAGKHALPVYQDAAGLDSSNNLEDTGACRDHGKLESLVPNGIPQNGNGDCSHVAKQFPEVNKQGDSKYPVEESSAVLSQLKSPNSQTAEDGVILHSVSPGSDVGKHDFVDVFLPKPDSQGFCAPPEEMITNGADAGKEQKVKSKVLKGKKKSSASRPDFSPDLASALNSPDSGHEKKLQGSATRGCSTKEPKAVTECGDELERRQEKSDIPHSSNQIERIKKMEAGEAPSEKFDAGSHAVQPGIRMECNTKELANPVASSDSTEDDTPCNAQRYCVAVRKVPCGRVGYSLKDSNKGFLPAKDHIFDDDSSSSSEGALHRAALKGYHSDSFSSSESNMDLDDTLSSQAKVIDYRVSTRGKRGDNGNEVQMPDSVGGRLNLGAILRNSSTYKKAKVLTSQQDDSESQLVDVVPETQPE